jgi:hypothetical protein
MKRLFGVIFVVAASIFFTACSNPFVGKAGLQVKTNDIRSGIYLNGKYMDKSPYLNQELNPGEYTLEIRPDDNTLVPYQTSISLKKGALSVVTWKPGNRPETSGGFIYEMEYLRNKKDSEISITTIPDGAIISVDGQARGFSPVLVDHVSPGTHEYEVSLPSYETQKNPINAIAGYRMNVTVKLAKQEYVAAAAVNDDANATGSAQVASSSASATNSATPATKIATTSAKTAAGASTTTTITTVPKPKVKIKPTGFKQDGEEVLRVRASAGAGGAEVGFAPVGNEYPYLKETSNGWHKISFDGKTGWVSGQFADLLE